MELFFLMCAAFGGTLLICQTLIGVLGLGSGHAETDGSSDVDHDVDQDVDNETGDDHGAEDGHDAEDGGGSAWYFGVLSFRALTAALTFFGLAGLAAHYADLGTPLSVVVAFVSGGGALYAVAALMRFLAQLKSDGTVPLERAVGQVGTVYLRVPANKKGLGKATLVLQNRTVEMAAITPDAELPTGSRIRVTSLIDANTVEVVSESAFTPSQS